VILKIALISQNVSPGFLIFRADFIKHLVSRGYSVYAFALDYSVESKLAVEALGAIPIEYSLNKAGMNPFRDLKDTWALSRKLKTISPDVVFSFFVKPSIYGTLAAKLACVPRRIAMLEGLGYIHTPAKFGFSFKKRILQRVHGLLCAIGYVFADKVLFLNSDDPVDLAKKSFLNPKKLQVIGPIGLDLSYFPYTEVNLNKPIRFIFIARLLEEKGVFEYLEAARVVKKQFPEVEFFILGGLDLDNPSALTKTQLDTLINDKLIMYPGYVNNVAEWVTASHVFVLPSYREGLPRSTQEAMAIGRMLAKKMLHLVNNPAEIKRMGKESHRIAIEKFDMNKINPVLADILLGID